MKVSSELLQQENLAHYSSWKVGGVANRVYKPSTIADLTAFIAQVDPSEPLLWLGLGSNTLVRDGGFKGTVIITQDGLRAINQRDDLTIVAEAGVSCATFARFAARRNLTGAEFMAGIPGTIGGALRMNAGCFNGETWNFVTSVTTLNRAGTLQQRLPENFDVSYRKVMGLADDEWFVSAMFRFQSGDKAHSLEMIKQLLARRADTQPTNEPNCGSVFRNPSGDYAARLIESCGLKGFKLGGAIVSPKHANFIVNDGTANARHIEELISHVANTVAQQTGVLLQREIHIVGEP